MSSYPGWLPSVSPYSYWCAHCYGKSSDRDERMPTEVALAKKVGFANFPARTPQAPKDPPNYPEGQRHTNSLRLLNALNSEDKSLKVRFFLAMIVFETFELILCQMLSSQGKNAPSDPYPHYLVRLAASRLVSPDFLPPARCDFSHARKGKRPLSGFFFEKAVFPFSRGKNRISQGVENRDSLISVPLAFRVVTHPKERAQVEFLSFFCLSPREAVALPSAIWLQKNMCGRKTPININNFAGLSRKWVGVKLFMCFPFFWGERETHKQTYQEISGKGRESPGTVPG